MLYLNILITDIRDVNNNSFGLLKRNRQHNHINYYNIVFIIKKDGLKNFMSSK